MAKIGVAKVKKFDKLVVPLEVEYTSPLLGRLFLLFACLRMVRVIKINLTMGNETVCSFYRLVLPCFLKGGASSEE